MEITSYALQLKAIRRNIASNKRALQLKANPKPSCLGSFKKENYEFGTSYNHVASQMVMYAQEAAVHHPRSCPNLCEFIRIC